MRISAIVLASGLSRRMGTDKLHMKIKGRNLYEYILTTLCRVPFYERIVVAKDEDILSRAESLGFLAVRNTKFYLGKSESIKAGLRSAKETDGFMFFVADQPFLHVETIRKLCRAFCENPSRIIQPAYNGIPGNPVIFPAVFLPQLMDLNGDRGGKAVLEKNKGKVIRVDIPSDLESVDIDTMEDYERARHIGPPGAIE